MYAKCGKLSSAEFLFHNSVAKDEVSWNTMIAGYVQSECANEPISAFLNLVTVCKKADYFQDLIDVR
nr:pentatricopeptide repeat-containing protein At2g39620 isoform X1 [Ipomoea trifida]